MTVQLEAFFLPATRADGSSNGQRFCLLHPCHSTLARGLVVYIHPFAEEMNKARRMAALQSRALAQAGYSVLQIDLLGCGDSSGDFGDATWRDWVSDVVQASHWLRSHSGKHAPGAMAAPLWLWGLRAGCLLAVEAAQKLDEACNLLFWQPVAAGKPLLQQFLRIKVAGDMVGGQTKGVMEAMRQQLIDGEALEIAGYMLSPGLAAGMEHAALIPSASAAPAQRVEWFELSKREDASLSPASTKTIAQWQQSGFEVRSHIAPGPAFWQTTEIEDAPALIATTTAALSVIST